MASTLEREEKKHKDKSDSSNATSPLDDHVADLAIEPDSDGSLIGPHVADLAIEEVGASRIPVAKPTEQSLCSYTLLEEIHRGKMKVSGKDIENPPSKGDAFSTEPLEKVISSHAPLKIFESPLDTSKK
ncbi:hypothetical protein E5676_scaffold609G00050 [Cucumis melo var. makuwa]|uniref:Uncharacterized protein n=1 Tax=Cucumis melo var. makuwa TaxID=1194695 RepID=A0A5D3DCJ3_CUCMM|nr:hypothetical protein E6C27_scaffold60G003130 [Cucumis melo var. makuwa]TYK21367.1 hypothetical protein E5676_scaffold609G00050 [Cucumis melo var. makuwa]